MEEYGGEGGDILYKRIDPKTEEWCVSFEGFKKLMRTRMTSRKPEEQIIEAFHIFSQGGPLTRTAMRAVAKELGENMSREEV